MFFFRKKKDDEKPRSKIIRKLVVGFIIGGAITSIVGKKVLQERRKDHLGEDAGE